MFLIPNAFALRAQMLLRTVTVNSHRCTNAAHTRCTHAASNCQFALLPSHAHQSLANQSLVRTNLLPFNLLCAPISRAHQSRVRQYHVRQSRVHTNLSCANIMCAPIFRAPIARAHQSHEHTNLYTYIFFNSRRRHTKSVKAHTMSVVRSATSVVGGPGHTNAGLTKITKLNPEPHKPGTPELRARA